jgi:hypothetical protein
MRGAAKREKYKHTQKIEYRTAKTQQDLFFIGVEKLRRSKSGTKYPKL